MQAIVRDASAVRGVRMVTLPDPGAPGPGMLRLRMRYAALNPADRMAAAGDYHPVGGLPPILGAEGMGVVEAIGTGVSGFSAGDRVMLLSRGNWAQLRCVGEREVLRVPDSLPDAQAAMLRINPATAARLLDRLALQPDDIVLQNAATSSVSGWVRRLCAERGVAVIDIVRSDPSDGAVLDGPDLAAQVSIIAAGRPVRGALDAVAGEATGRLATCVSVGATLIVYGHLSGQPCTVASTLLTTKSLTMAGFTLREAEAGQDMRALSAFYTPLAALMAAQPETIAAVFSLDAIDDALAYQPQQRGRILLSCS